MPPLDPRRGIIELVPKKGRKPLREPHRPSEGVVLKHPQAPIPAVRLDDSKIANQVAEQVIKHLTNLLPTIPMNQKQLASAQDDASLITIDTSIVDVGIEEEEIKEGEFTKQINENSDIVKDQSLKKSKEQIEGEASWQRKRQVNTYPPEDSMLEPHT